VNTITRHAVNITAFAATFFFAAFDAHAERATFNLPFEAHWGSVTLPPGKYTINVPLAVSWPQQITLTVKGKVLSISPLTEGVTTEPKGSYLQLVSLGGTYFFVSSTLDQPASNLHFACQSPLRVNLASKAKMQAKGPDDLS
jgi:hypothetical protein